MKKIIAAAILLMASAQAFAVMATWTGQVQYVTTVSYKQGMSCQYTAPGGTFWLTFKLGSCPFTVEMD